MFLKHAAAVYSATGERPDGPAWDRLEARRDLNPERFDRNHPSLAGLFHRADCVGDLPDGGIFVRLRSRYELDPDRFTLHHPFWGRLFERESLTICPPICDPSHPGIPETCPPPVQPVPEPGSLGLAASGVACCLLFAAIKRKVRPCLTRP
jgi:hypothetical protein